MAIVVLTGCSSGFGLEGALAFARAGDTVFASMRDLSRGSELERLAMKESLAITLVQLDITRPETFPAFVSDIVKQAGGIDVLVNNAGINRAGAFEDTEPDTLRLVMETNCVGPLLLTRAVLPQMRKQQTGLIIMMSSLSGVAGLPGDVAYTASKFGLEGATEALRHEVDRWGIRVALVQAGLYSTSIFDDSLDGEDLLPPGYPDASPYRALVAHRLNEIQQRLPEAFDPRDVAELFVAISRSDTDQLRWPADPVAKSVLKTLFGHDDHGRDSYLKSVSGTQWWSKGQDAP